MNPRYVAMVLVVLCMAVCLGCGQDNPLGRKAIRGKVMLDGQPLPKGSITFLPAKGEASMSGAAIVKGTYEIAEEKGLAPGEYVARLSAPDPSGRVIKVPGMQDRVADIIPPEYGDNSQQKVTVTPNGPNEFNFDIKTK